MFKLDKVLFAIRGYQWNSFPPLSPIITAYLINSLFYFPELLRNMQFLLDIYTPRNSFLNNSGTANEAVSFISNGCLRNRFLSYFWIYFRNSFRDVLFLDIHREVSRIIPGNLVVTLPGIQGTCLVNALCSHIIKYSV